MVPSFSERKKKIIALICEIPPGQVASYGQVAELAGIPRGARLVVRVLRDSAAVSAEGEAAKPVLPWWRVLRADDEQVDLRAADRIYAALTYLASTFVIGEETLAREIRLVALAHLRDGAEVLACGAPRAWEPGDDVCPPWPWGSYVAVGTAAADGHGSRWQRERAMALPPRAADLLDGLNLIQAYTLAAKYVDAAPRAATTIAIGASLMIRGWRAR